MSDDNNINDKYSKFRKIIIMILSFAPGCGHMYMGLMKRGMFLLLAFFSCCYLASSVFFRVFTFGVFIIWLFSIFDAYYCRKKMEKGKTINDDIDDVKHFLVKYRKIIISCFSIVCIIEFIRGSIIFNYAKMAGDVQDSGKLLIDNILIFLLICIGIYCLFFRKK